MNPLSRRAEEGKITYREAYDSFSAMTYAEAYYLLNDAKILLATKIIMGMDSANLSEHEKGALLSVAKEISDLYAAGEVALKAYRHRRDLTQEEKQ